MATYLISYDLKRVKNYPRLYTCLNAWGAQRLLESLWMVRLPARAPAIIAILARCIDGDDAIAVIEVTSNADWATLRVRRGGVAYLKAFDLYAA